MKEITANMKSFIISSFENDKELNSVMFEYFLEELNEGDNLEVFLYETADILYKSRENILFNNGLSAVEFYELEYSKYLKNINYEKESVFYSIEKSINKNFSNKEYRWQEPKNRRLYVQIVASYLHSSIKNFFFENRKRFLPEYDWFLIDKDKKRKLHIEAFFKEFDKFASIVESISNYVDLSKIPKDYLSYMSSILGIKMITEQEITTHDQIRSVIGNMVSVYKQKGSLGGLEMFLGALGIGINVNEMYFDRRMFWYSKDDEQFWKNQYTNVLSTNRFAYYLTPNNPLTTYYPLAPNEIVKSLNRPISESMFDQQLEKSKNILGVINEKKVLGYEVSDKNEIVFDYFKTNTVIIEFYFFHSKESLISMKYQKLLEDYMSAIIPVYVRKYYPTILFEETDFKDALSFTLYGASGYSFVLEELYKYENMDNKSVSFITPYESGNTWEKGSEGDKIEKDFIPVDKHQDIDSLDNRLNFLLSYKRVGDVQVGTEVVKFPISFDVVESEGERETRLSFETEDINIVKHYGFTFNPTINTDSIGSIDAGNIGVVYEQYGNSIKSVSLLNAEEDETLSISIT